MCNFEKSYKAFSLALEAEIPPGRNSAQVYREICRKLRVSPSDLDEILLEEVGMAGEDIVEVYRSGFGEHKGQPHEIFNSQSFRPKVEN